MLLQFKKKQVRTGNAFAKDVYEATFRSWALGEKESQQREFARYQAAAAALIADVGARRAEAEAEAGVGGGAQAEAAGGPGGQGGRRRATTMPAFPFPEVRDGALRQPGGWPLDALTLLRQAVATRGPFKDALTAELAALRASCATTSSSSLCDGAELSVADVKSLGRVAQKELFECAPAAYADGHREADVGAVKDMVRAMVSFRTMGGVAAFVEALTASERLCVVRVKNRFEGDADNSGWHDLLLNVTVTPTAAAAAAATATAATAATAAGGGKPQQLHICEVQVVLHQVRRLQLYMCSLARERKCFLVLLLR